MARRIIEMTDFSHGLLLVPDSNDNLDPKTTPNALNARIMRNGGIEGILGGGASPKDLGVGEVGHDIAAFTPNDTNHYAVVATGSKWIALNANFSRAANFTATTIRSGMTANTDTTFVVHNGKLYGLDEANDMATWDGTTLTVYAPGVDTGPPRGIILGIWEGKMFVALPDSMDVVWSDVFDATTGFVGATGMWPTGNRVTLGGSAASRTEKIVGGGVTADGVFVVTDDACYLIYDSDNGFNRVVDSSGGCLSRRSLAFDGSYVYGVNRKGIWRTTGSLPLEYLSDSIAPAFSEDGVSTATLPAGVIYDGSYWVSLSHGSGAWRSDSANNCLTYEVNLVTGSIMRHLGAMASLAFCELPLRPTSGLPAAPLLLRVWGSYANADHGRYVHDSLMDPLTAITGLTYSSLMYLYTQPFVSGRKMRLHEVSVVGTDPAGSATVTVSELWGSKSPSNTITGTVRWAAGGTGSRAPAFAEDYGSARINGASSQAMAVYLLFSLATATTDGNSQRKRVASVSQIQLEVSDAVRRVAN